MPKQPLIYGSINEYSSTEFIERIGELEEAGSDIVVRVNTPGGSPEYGWGMISRFNEAKGNKRVQNDGRAFSMGLYFNCYVPKDQAKALDVTQFLLHRAAYPSWMEKDPAFADSVLFKNLELINKNLRAAFEARVDVEAFENLKSVKDKGITLDRIFSMEERIDVIITAKEAKKIGLIGEIIKITPEIKAEVETLESSFTFEIAAKYEGKKEEPKTQQPQPQKNKTMTVEEYKIQHPEAFNKIIEMGVEKERDRVGSIMAFNDVDPATCQELIKTGKHLTETQRSEFLLQAVGKGKNKEAAAESAATIVTAEIKPEDVKKKLEDDFLADVKAGR